MMIGKHSLRRSNGEGRSCGVQKRCVPSLEKAISDASPEKISRPISIHAGVESASSCVTSSPSGFINALSSVSLPMNPDSGGMPIISNAQAIKLRPRNAMVMGMT